MTTNELIENHIELANKIAWVRKKSLPKCVQFDEIQSAAYYGLTKAANKYNVKLCDNFAIYAGYRINCEIKDYLRTLQWNGRGKTVTIAPLEDDYASIPETDSECFEELTKSVSPLDKQILYMYFVDSLTLTKIAEKIGLSCTRVHQLLKSSLEHIRSVQKCDN